MFTTVLFYLLLYYFLTQNFLPCYYDVYVVLHLLFIWYRFILFTWNTEVSKSSSSHCFTPQMPLTARDEPAWNELSELNAGLPVCGRDSGTGTHVWSSQRRLSTRSWEQKQSWNSSPDTPIGDVGVPRGAFTAMSNTCPYVMLPMYLQFINSSSKVLLELHIIPMTKWNRL